MRRGRGTSTSWSSRSSCLSWPPWPSWSPCVSSIEPSESVVASKLRTVAGARTETSTLVKEEVRRRWRCCCSCCCSCCRRERWWDTNERLDAVLAWPLTAAGNCWKYCSSMDANAAAWSSEGRGDPSSDETATPRRPSVSKSGTKGGRNTDDSDRDERWSKSCCWWLPRTHDDPRGSFPTACCWCFPGGVVGGVRSAPFAAWAKESA
ncbi:hypothetical protein VTK73DRAFT_6328 [Phialemonium thermophilum]|uniref:Secreted protein n=1 Tax=Phialemonium thermophilum TaxID=223376 RepID=A0ABR3UZM4_9PEZI